MVLLAAAGCGGGSSSSLTNGHMSIGAGLQGPAGLKATVYASGLAEMSAFAFDTQRRLWVAVLPEGDDRGRDTEDLALRLDHVGVEESYRSYPTDPGLFEYFHLNSIGVDSDGDLLISARHTRSRRSDRTGLSASTPGSREVV